MNYEILSIETAGYIADLEQELKSLRILTAKGIKKQQKIEEALRYLNNVIENQDIFSKEDLLFALNKIAFILKERQSMTKFTQYRLFGAEEDLAEKELKDNNYTAKVNIPQYEITGEKPNIYTIANYNKYFELLRKIDDSNVEEAEKQFLKYAATRHIQFNYQQIAEYYAHASKEMQELMEDSALVIIDFKDAIAKGYTLLMDRFGAIEEEDLLENGDVYED